MALEDPSTTTNPKKMSIDDMKILYEHSMLEKVF
jgi:alcohol dehydrogenase